MELRNDTQTREDIPDLDQLQAESLGITSLQLEELQDSVVPLIEAAGAIVVGSAVSVEKWWTTNRIGTKLDLTHSAATKVAQTFRTHYRHLVWQTGDSCRIAPEALPALQIIKSVIYPDPPEGWLTLTQIADATNRGKGYLTPRVAEICAAQTDWQRVIPHGDRAVPYFDPAVLEAIQKQEPEPAGQPLEGWMTRAAATKAFQAADATIVELAAPVLAEHPEWKQSFTNRQGRTYDYLSPEVVAHLREKLSGSVATPEGWQTATALGRILKTSKEAVVRRAAAYEEEHPEWFQTYRAPNGRWRRHFHPDLVAALTVESEEVELPSEQQWEKRMDVARRLGTAYVTVQKYAEPYRKEHPEWFGEYKHNETGKVVKYYHHHLVMILEARLRRLVTLPSPPPGWVTITAIREQMPVSNAKLNKVVTILREKHPGWVKPYRDGAGRATDHFSPELQTRITAMSREEIDALIEQREGPKQRKTRKDKKPPRPPKPKQELSGKEQQKVLACIACRHVCLEGEDLKELRPFKVQECAGVTQAATHAVFTRLEAKGRIERQPPGARYGYFTLTAAGLRFLANRNLQDVCFSGRRDPTAQPLRFDIPAVILPGSPQEKTHAHVLKKPAVTKREAVPVVEALPNKPLDITATPEQRQFLFEFWDQFEAFCIKLNSRYGADIAQSARVKFLTKVPAAVNVPPTMRAWLFTTARNEHITRWHKNEKRNQTTDPADFSQLGGSDSGVDAKVMESVDREEARAVIEALPRLLEPDQWKLVEDLYILGKSVSEVAAEYGTSRPTIYTRKSRVWQTLRRIAKQQEESGEDLGLPNTEIIRELLAAKEG